MMVKKRLFLLFALITLGMWSCVTEIRDFEQISNDALLTVEGSLSNQIGPHRVTVSTSSPSLSINVENTPIKKAQVFITDNKGGREDLTELVDGIYETAASFKGIIGNIYTLHINLQNGKKYESTPEKLLAAPTIDKVNSNFTVKTNYPLTDVKSVGFDVSVEFKDSPETGQYYQWKWTHYERTTFCASCNIGYDYNLGRCSLTPDYPYGQSSPELINYPCSSQCFDILFNSTYNILSDNLLNGQEIKNYPILRIPFNDRTKYYLKIEQRVISEKIYRYYRSIKDVTQSSGTLFDVPAETQLSPNIFNVNNSNEKILGLFEVFGSDKRIIYIDRQVGTDGYVPVSPPSAGRVLPPPPGAISGPRAYCIEGKYRTKREPEAWKD